MAENAVRRIIPWLAGLAGLSPLLAVEAQTPPANPVRVLQVAQQEAEAAVALRKRSHGYEVLRRTGLMAAAVKFHSLLKDPAAAPAAYAGLGFCDSGLGACRQAAEEYDRALAGGAPDAAGLAARRAEAQQMAAIARRAVSHLPAGEAVLQVEKALAGGPDAWLVLAARVESDPGSTAQEPRERYRDLRLLYLTGAKAWLSPPLRDPRPDLDESNDVALYQVEMGSGGPPVALVEEILFGASWLPSHLDAFTFGSGRLTKVFGLTSSQPIWVEDLNHDGRVEIGSTYEIGEQMPHVEQPRWTDVYAWNGRGFSLANRRFPALFRAYPASLRVLLRKYPSDAQIRKYLRIAEGLAAPK